MTTTYEDLTVKAPQSSDLGPPTQAPHRHQTWDLPGLVSSSGHHWIPVPTSFKGPWSDIWWWLLNHVQLAQAGSTHLFIPFGVLSFHKCDCPCDRGESGAGKTENTKKVIQYFAYTAAKDRSSKSNVSPSEVKGCLL